MCQYLLPILLENAAEALSLELENEADKINLTDDAKKSLGVYQYIGRLKKGGKIHPIYKLRGEENKPTHLMYLIKEWDPSDRGFNGWIGAVIVTFIKFQVMHIEKN